MRSRSVAQESVLPLATLLLLALVVAGPLWGPGLLNTRGGGDSPFLLLRVHQLAANLGGGIIPARWMPDAAYGFGYPFFNYYSALPYYLAAGFTLIGVNILCAIKFTQTLFSVGAALGMYGWARRILGSRAGGWLAAAGYALAPYHLVNVYVRGDSLSEFAAFAFYPLVLWGLDSLAAHPSLRRTFFPALTYAGLITTHNLSAFVFSPFALLYLAALTWRGRKQRRRILSFGLWALGFGAMLSAWYWLPALAEADYGQLEVQTTGYFFYGNHFRGTDLVQPGLIFEYDTAPGSPASFAAMGLVQAALALAGILVVIAEKVRSRSIGHDSQFEIPRWSFVLVSLTLTTWLITSLSRPLWDRVPLLPMIQFPWRLLSVQALFTAILTGASITPLRRWRWPAAAILAVPLAVAGLAGLKPEYLPITAEEVTVERLQLYELFTSNIGSTIRYEYLPRWVVPRPFTGPSLLDPGASPRALSLNGDLMSAEETIHEPTHRVWVVEAKAGGAEVAFPLYYWPGWQATVDGSPTETSPAPGAGTLTLTVPAGRHTVAMRLGRTPLRAVAETISTAAIMALLVGVIASYRHISSLKSLVIRQLPLAILCLALAVCLTLLVLFSPRVAPVGETDLTMDFDRMPYLHHNPGGAILDGWRLTGYSYSAERLVPGETLRVSLDWETDQETNAILRLVSPAAIRQNELSAAAEATLPIAGGAGSTSLELPIPRNLGPGLYLIQLEDRESEVYLRPVWVVTGDTATTQPASATFADGALRLHAVEEAQITPDRLDLRLDWSATRPIVANYKLSLRLADPAGNEWARVDAQPGYGFLPTSLWPVGSVIYDRYTLALPAGVPPGESYTLTMILYQAATGETIGEYALPVSLNLVTLRPDAPSIAHFGDELTLSKLEVPEHVRQGESLDLAAYWQAVQEPTTDYIAQWHLETTGQSISDTLPLAPGSLPTTWPAGAWIAGRATLPIPSTALPGDYTLSLTLRDPTNGTPAGSYTLPRPVRVQGRERIWELPPMRQRVDVDFGGMIELAGYDLRQEGDTLRLALHWQALAVPDRHYMLFIHLADPTTGWPVAQVDTMPRGFTYPTGMWAPGEVVSDEVLLSLADVPAGEYELAIGWYDPETSVRLSATDRAGNPLPDNRLTLPSNITLP